MARAGRAFDSLENSLPGPRDGNRRYSGQGLYVTLIDAGGVFPIDGNGLGRIASIFADNLQAVIAR